MTNIQKLFKEKKLTNREFYTAFFKDLHENGKATLPKIHTIHNAERRKGKINGTFGNTPKYERRGKIDWSVEFKDRLNKLK